MPYTFPSHFNVSIVTSSDFKKISGFDHPLDSKITKYYFCHHRNDKIKFMNIIAAFRRKIYIPSSNYLYVSELILCKPQVVQSIFSYQELIFPVHEFIFRQIPFGLGKRTKSTMGEALVTGGPVQPPEALFRALTASQMDKLTLKEVREFCSS